MLYDAAVTGFDIDQATCVGIQLRVGEERCRLRAHAVVVATGGFESNIEWLKEVWGDAADNFIVRGTPYNTGAPLKQLLEAGAQAVGDPHGCHAIAVDARAPRFDGGIVTRLDCIPLGIVVNKHGERFADEGQDVWPKRYASWGSLIARQPEQIAYCVVDAKAIGRFMPSVFPPIVADSIPALATGLGLAPEAIAATVASFNQAIPARNVQPRYARRLPDRRARSREIALGAAAR